MSSSARPEEIVGLLGHMDGGGSACYVPAQVMQEVTAHMNGEYGQGKWDFVVDNGVDEVFSAPERPRAFMLAGKRGTVIYDEVYQRGKFVSATKIYDESMPAQLTL